MSQAVKEIIVFAHGNPRNTSTWSNVPACIIRSFEKKGIVVHSVDLLCHPISSFYDLFIRRVISLLLISTHFHPPYFVHTRLHRWLAERKIRRCVYSYTNVDFCLFFGYLFSNHYNMIPSVLIGDWTLKDDLSRKELNISRCYNDAIRQETDAICHADYVFSIFDSKADEMQRRYPSANINYIGKMFVNNCYSKNLSKDKIITKKNKSRIILFIGRSDRYKESAQRVVSAFEHLLLDKRYERLQLHIIGIKRKQLRISSKNVVFCHGYLNKSDPQQNREYYQLLIDAKMLINPSPNWAAYSSLIEAMYFYTPVIVSPFDVFVREFGVNIGFGKYIHTMTDEGICENIKSLYNDPNYIRRCENAHERVKTRTCDNYTSELIKYLQK